MQTWTPLVVSCELPTAQQQTLTASTPDRRSREPATPRRVEVGRENASVRVVASLRALFSAYLVGQDE